MKKGTKSTFLIILTTATLMLGVFYLVNNKERVTGQNQTAIPVSSTEATKWKTYESGELILNSDFSITYPQGWHFKYREDKSIGYLTNLGATRMEFDISPPEWKVGIGLNEWSGYTSIAVEIYPQSSTLNKWISSFLPKYENRLIIEYKKIGNKTAYLLKGKPDPSDRIDLAAGFAHRYVVLGKRHSYVVGFGNDGTVGSIERMQNEIFPGFRFID